MHIDTDVNGNCRLLLCYCTSNWAGDNERWCVLRTFIAFQKNEKEHHRGGYYRSASQCDIFQNLVGSAGAQACRQQRKRVLHI